MKRHLLKYIAFGFCLCLTQILTARCLGYMMDLNFYLTSKNVCIVKVLELKTINTTKIYKVQTLKTFRDSLKEEFFIYTHNNDIDWQEDADAGLNIDSVYLLMPHLDKTGRYLLSGCSYIVSSKDRDYRHDSICFSDLSRSNGYINNGYYKGQIKNGKPDGYWIDMLDTGLYKAGKRVGEWKIVGQKAIYRNGRCIYSEERWPVDTVIIYDRRQHQNTMICRGETLAVWTFKKRRQRIDKFKNGLLFQSFSYDKNNDIIHVKCFDKGKLVYTRRFYPKTEGKMFESEKNFDPEGYFYYNAEYKCR